ncbi:NAD(P)H-dependent oxidoreductase [Streptomyces capparidis]|jgi:NAD(P)H-dependent FMN reductase
MSSDQVTQSAETAAHDSGRDDAADRRLRVAVIVGSVREGRFAPTVAKWFASQVEQHDDIEMDLIDLADVPLAASMRQTPVGDEFAARIERADAFVVITPEYNHGYPGALKLAIDSVYGGWQGKAVGFVSYGGVSGGLRAVEQLRQVFAETHTVSMRDTVSFHAAWEQFDEDGGPKNLERVNGAAKVMLDQLVWWGTALREARAKRPYGS